MFVCGTDLQAQDKSSTNIVGPLLCTVIWSAFVRLWLDSFHNVIRESVFHAEAEEEYG
jgi:hypothetical protein